MAHTSKSTTTRSTKTTISKKPPRSAPSRGAQGRPEGTDFDPAVRHQMIAEAAYLRAELRGFGDGDPLDDWLAAEREVDSLLAERATQVTQ